MEYPGQKLPVPHGFLEDRLPGGSADHFEYDYDQYGGNAVNGQGNNGHEAHPDTLQKKFGKRFAEDNFEGVDDPAEEANNSHGADGDDFQNVTPRQQIQYIAEPEPEIGILFFCMWESKPKDFINFVVNAKIADLVIYCFVFGFIAIYIQAAFSLLFYLVKHRLQSGKSSHMLMKGTLYTMIAQNFYISVIFMINLIRSSNSSKPLYIVYLVMVYFIWITQNIAWDFQLIENSGLFLDLGETVSQGIIGNESTQLKDRGFPSEQVSTKSKIKRRTPSSLNNSAIGI